jgi:hypothetical protein
MKILGQLFFLVLLFASCGWQSGSTDASRPEENLEAKAMLQGIWIEDETDEVSFRAKGDTIYYPDSTSLPAYFMIVNDSLWLGDGRYAIVKQTEHLFLLQNQNGDEVRYRRSESEDDSLAFVSRRPEILTVTEVLKMDSVVSFGAERYHWYIAVNPTRYRVVKTAYNSEGVGVDNVYYDNIIHLSLYNGSRSLFSRDFKKQMFSDMIPNEFLEQAILGNMQYDHIDAHGCHFNATLCIPDGASCYLVDVLIAKDGKLSMTLLEY